MDPAKNLIERRAPLAADPPPVQDMPPRMLVRLQDAKKTNSLPTNQFKDRLKIP
jgi:hypothetical protein